MASGRPAFIATLYASDWLSCLIRIVLSAKGPSNDPTLIMLPVLLCHTGSPFSALESYNTPVKKHPVIVLGKLMLCILTVHIFAILQSAGPIQYHSQVSLCHKVWFALKVFARGEVFISYTIPGMRLESGTTYSMLGLFITIVAN